MKRLIASLGLAALIYYGSGCNINLNNLESRVAALQPSPTATITPTATYIPLPTATFTPIPTPTKNPITQIPTSTPIPKPTNTPTPTYIPTPTPYIPGSLDYTNMIFQSPKMGIRAKIVGRGVDKNGVIESADYAVAHYIYSLSPMGGMGNSVLTAHDDIKGEIFRNLDWLEPGDEVGVSDTKTNCVYVVRSKKVVLPNDMSIIYPSKEPILTLITCTPYRIDTHRLVVVAELKGCYPR